jgi:hypothetical protein
MISRSRRAKEFVFSELRTTLKALSGLHNRARGGESIGKDTPLSPSAEPQTLTFPMTERAKKAEGRPTYDGNAALSSFVIEEDRHHLEEAVLIAMDHGVEGDVVNVAREAALQQFRRDIDPAALMKLSLRFIGSIHEQKFGRFEIDGPDGSILE